jgi:hypothetical protein
MALLEKGKISAVFAISTSKNPPSCLADSYGTPTGLHAVADKIGADAPEGQSSKAECPQDKSMAKSLQKMRSVI